MPIARLPNGRLLYFAHVPKCAGTAVEHWLEAAFGPLAFRDPRYLSRPEAARWTRTSPQHMDRHAMSQLFPDGFFDASFAVVRHPVARLVSVFRFQRDIELTVHHGVTFGDWLHMLEQGELGASDNHTRAMDDIVPKTARVFMLENGLDPLREHIQTLTGPDGARLPEIAAKNVTEDRLRHEGKPSFPVTPSDADKHMIHRLYKNDFERFSYTLENERQTQ